MRSSSTEDLDIGEGCCIEESLYPTFEEVMAASMNETDYLRIIASLDHRSFSNGVLIDLRIRPEKCEERYRRPMDARVCEGSLLYRDKCSTSMEDMKMAALLPSSEPSRRPQAFTIQGNLAQLPLVEVSPGVFMNLRGSSETWQALQAGRVTVTTCQLCCQLLRCVQDAECVLCPTCRVVSPLQGTCTGSRRGLGLGLRIDA